MTTPRVGLKIKRNGDKCELLELVSGEGMVRQCWLVRWYTKKPPRLDYLWLLTYRELHVVDDEEEQNGKTFKQGG